MSYAKYIDNYDRKAYGEGHDHDPAVDRFSGRDVRKMYRAGHKEYGKSKKEAAQMVLDYAEKVKGKTKMGGATRDALNKLKEIASKPDPIKTIPKQPHKDKPKEVKKAIKDFKKSKLEKKKNQQPKMSELIEVDDMGNPTSDPNLDAIKHGDDLNEWYQTKFVPHLESEAMATAHEIGNSTRYFIDKFVFEPPQLGDPKELYEYYEGKIKSD